ncbi:ATP-dependent DNA helicase [Quadrisphaera sp. DSM 44207]|uniref:ATP-dependent helicase n=1 Tax=Quadrisphaera sp. DSM 44207 TaxID=1881057 RepID=UPI000889D69A|nr:ATP-dependent DNA helicase [Quadrisphaera sp. DSM 44207]SDQ72323.1 Superfamily I DNA or RNA helicase [Quadrisphaera sp. DSM 44207]
MITPASSPTAARGAPAPVLVRRPGPGAHAPELDAEQQRVVDHRRGAGPLVVLGAPGTGRTTALVEALVARVERDGDPVSSLLVLAPGRRAAASLRDRVSARLARTATEPLVRTPHAYAWALLRRAAVRAGDEPVRLLSGPEQDQALAELLRGHEAGDAPAPDWPAGVDAAVRRLRGFRAELRDLVMRAQEHALPPAQLARLGIEHGRPEWGAAAQVLAEHRQVSALADPGAHDPAAIVQDAVALLRADPPLLAAERARLTLVAVEDHHESTAAVSSLLDLLAGGPDLLLAGDPDATTSGFRGGDPALLVEAAQRHRRADGRPAPVVVLRTRWRHGRDLAAAVRRVEERIGSRGAVAHRAAGPAPSAPDGAVEGHVLRSSAQQAAFVAGLLRREHLVGGTPWGAMAVVVRSGRATAALRRALTAAGVPVALPPASVPLREEPAVRPLVTALRAVLRQASRGAPALEEVLELLAAPVGAADALALRRLRQGLLAVERAGGGARGSDELLVEAVLDPDRCAALPERAARPARAVARVLAAGRRAAADPGAGVEAVLWALWEATGLAHPWREQALSGGPAGARADRDLDAVVALFDAAARFEERSPAAPAQRFLEHLEAQDVPSDTLAEHSPDDDAVALVTPQGASGREWDVVVVAGLQEGAWPDARLRGALLGAGDLADLLAGRGTGRGTGGGTPEAVSAARHQQLDDERRLLLVAVSRARRRLVATAVRTEDERPSAFLDLVAPLPPADSGLDGVGGAGGVPERLVTPVPRPMTLPGLVGELRSVLLTPLGSVDATGARVDAARHAGAAAGLARLAAAGVPGADPVQWYGLAPLSDDGPLRGPEEPVRVSPSAVESFARCALRWLLEGSGGRPADSVSQGVGVLVHEVAQALPSGSAQEMTAELERLWPRLGLPDTWAGRRELARARRMVVKLAAYVAQAREAGREVLAVEADVEVRVGRALVRGRIDRVEREPGGALRVVDLKTGARKPSREEVPVHPQLGLYQVLVGAGALDRLPGALPDGRPGPAAGAGAALVQLGGETKGHGEQLQPALAGAPDPAWAHRLVAQTAEGMGGRVFAATENDLCSRCAVSTCCPGRPEGRQVGS